MTPPENEPRTDVRRDPPSARARASVHAYTTYTSVKRKREFRRVCITKEKAGGRRRFIGVYRKGSPWWKNGVERAAGRGRAERAFRKETVVVVRDFAQLKARSKKLEDRRRRGPECGWWL